MSGIEFQQPSRLWWLLVALAAVAGYLWLRSRLAPTIEKRFTTLEMLEQAEQETGNRWRRWLPIFLSVLVIAAIVVQWAEPVYGQEQQTESAAAVFLIDCSDSMRAEDVEPSRIEAVKTAAIGSAENAPASVRLGFVCFHNNVEQILEATDNRLEFEQKVEDLMTDRGGTDIHGAISAGTSQVETLYPDDTTPPAALVLLSDGAPRDESESWSLSLQRAVDNGLAIHTVAFGTDSGTVTVEIDGTETEQPVPVELDVLQEIAQTTGGNFYESADSADLEDIYNGLIAETATEVVMAPITWGYQAAVVAAVLAALAYLWVYRTRWSR